MTEAHALLEDGSKEARRIVNDRDSDRYRSDIEPIDVIFKRIAQKEQVVPRSIERGASYQAVHDPAPSSTGSPADAVPSVLLDVTTAPDARCEPVRVDAEPRRATLTALALALLLAMAIAARWCSR
jgi:hypothetical protein